MTDVRLAILATYVLVTVFLLVVVPATTLIHTVVRLVKRVFSRRRS